MKTHEELFSHRNKLCPHFKPTPNREKWEEEFEKTFDLIFNGCGVGYGSMQIGLKDFIRQTLASQKAKDRLYVSGPSGVRMVECENCKNIVEKLKGMMKQIPQKSFIGDIETGTSIIYNQTIDDIIKSLTEKGDE